MHKYEYDFSQLGQRVYIAEIPNWLTDPVKKGYCILQKNMTGKIIGSTIGKDKIAVEFDQRIWTIAGAKVHCGLKEFTTDCNGKGKPGYCAYFYPIQVQLFTSNPVKSQLLTALERKKLLLLSL